MKTKGFIKALALLLSLVMMSAAFTMLAYAGAPELTTFTTNNGASVRIGDVAGIRFKTTISKTEFNAVKDSITEIGTIIAPKAYVANEQVFTMDALATVNNGAEGYVKVIANKSQPFAEDSETVAFAGSLENIKVANYTLEYVARGYVVIGGTTYYAEMSDARTVGYTSYKAYLDTASGLGDSAKSLIAPFANAYLVEELGSGAPTIDRVRYYENFNDANTYSDLLMNPATLASDSATVAQKYGITVTSADTDMTPSFWIDNGRLMISTFTGITGDTRGKDTAGGFAFFTLDALKNSQLQSQIYSDAFTIQYDITYSFRNVGGVTNVYDTATWVSNFITLMNMDRTSGTACGLAAGGHVRLEYFTDKVGAILTEESMFVRGKGLSNKLRESDVGTITVRIQVDPEANTIKLYGKTGTMTQFELLAETSATSAGYAAMSAATSELIGFGIQYGNNAMLDNLIIYN